MTTKRSFQNFKYWESDSLADYTRKLAELLNVYKLEDIDKKRKLSYFADLEKRLDIKDIDFIEEGEFKVE